MKQPVKSKCRFGNDTCDGINGTSGFLCRDCVEDAEWDAQETNTATDNLRANPYELPIATITKKTHRA